MRKLLLCTLLTLPLALVAGPRTLADGYNKDSNGMNGNGNGHMDHMDGNSDHMDMNGNGSMDMNGNGSMDMNGKGRMDRSNGKKMNGSKKTNGMMSKGSGKLEWFDNYSEAMQKAQKEHKMLFLYFTGSDWCGWCKKLDQEVLAQPEFAKMVGNKFVFVKLDFPMNRNNDAFMQQNTKLKQQYGVTGFPTVVILDSKGAFVGETGYRSGGPRSYADHIEQLSSSHSY